MLWQCCVGHTGSYSNRLAVRRLECSREGGRPTSLSRMVIMGGEGKEWVPDGYVDSYHLTTEC